MRRAIVAALLLILATTPVSSAPSDDIRGHCASIHRSYEYRLICEREEKGAKDRLYRSVDLPYGIPRDIWEYCAGIHSSWQYVEICTRRELRAKGQLGR